MVNEQMYTIVTWLIVDLVGGDGSELLEDLRDLRLGGARGGHDDGEGEDGVAANLTLSSRWRGTHSS